MDELRYSGYYTDCYYKLGNRWHHSDNHACFADLIRNYDRNNPEFKVLLYKLGSRGAGNASVCLVGEKEISNHLKQVQDLVQFEFSITESENYWEVYLKVSTEEPNVDLCCRFVLTWLRYLYESPYNVIMLDVNRLKQNLPAGTFESSFNLFGLVAHTYKNGVGANFNTGHTIHSHLGSYWGESEGWDSLISKAVLREKLKDKKILRVNSLVTSVYCPDLKSLPGTCFSNKKDMEFWENDKEFLVNRLPVLLENYEKLKLKKIYE